MKKLAFVLGLSVLLIGGLPARAAESDILEKLALYIPNRIVDAFDCGSLSLGVGLGIRAELAVTQAICVGFGVEDNVFTLYKDYNRQYGGGFQNGYYWQLVCIGEENQNRDRVFGLVRSYWESYVGFPMPTQRVYDFYEGARDYWKVGGALGCLLCGDLYLHPVEGIDFLLGFFLIDIRGDDLTFDDFR